MDSTFLRRTVGNHRAWRQLVRRRRLARQPYRCLSCTIKPQAAASSGSKTSTPSSAADEATTHFGYQTVAASMKEAKVGAVFSSVASSYDTMNDLMSLGIHRLWKDYFVRSLDPGVKRVSHPRSSSSSLSTDEAYQPRLEDQQEEEGWNILDVAGGTGDIAFRMLDHATLVHNDHRTRVTVADINKDMLAEGRKRSLQYPTSPSSSHQTTPQSRPWDPSRLDFLHANAESMPMIASNSIDLYTVAFGIRNFTDKPAALREAYRVLKPGGVFACLEFGKVDRRIPFFEAIYKRWSFGVIPLIGHVVAGDRDSYQYLVESIDRFPAQPDWRDMIRDAGFLIPGFGPERGEEEGDVGGNGDGKGDDGEGRGMSGQGRGWVDLSGGIAAVHKGVKPVASPST